MAEREAGIARSAQHAVHVLPHAPNVIPRFLGPALERVAADANTTQLLVITPDADTALAIADVARSISGRPAPIVPITAAGRGGRLLASRVTPAIAAAPSTLMSLLRSSAVKLDGVRTVVITWANELFEARQITPWKMNCGDGPEFSSKGKHWVLFGCEPDVDSSNLFSVPDNLYMVHPNGTGLYQLTHTDADKHYVGSSFSPEFHNGWGDIVAARYNAYRDEGTSDLFHMHVDTGGVRGALNLTKSETLDDSPDWGTHPPSLKTLYLRGCAPVPKEPDEASKCY